MVLEQQTFDENYKLNINALYTKHTSMRFYIYNIYTNIKSNTLKMINEALQKC